MSLDLSPNEYMATSRELYETAMAYQGARSRGIEKAREDHEKKKDSDRKWKESQERVNAKAGMT